MYDYIYIYIYIWLFTSQYDSLISWHVNLRGLFNAKTVFIDDSSDTIKPLAEM